MEAIQSADRGLTGRRLTSACHTLSAGNRVHGPASPGRLAWAGGPPAQAAQTSRPVIDSAAAALLIVRLSARPGPGLDPISGPSTAVCASPGRLSGPPGRPGSGRPV